MGGNVRVIAEDVCLNCRILAISRYSRSVRGSADCFLDRCWIFRFYRPVVDSSSAAAVAMCHFLLPNRRYLWVSFSRSGESPEAVAVLENALREHPEIKHLVVCCNKEGRLLKIGAGKPHALCMPLAGATHDRGLAMTSSFSSMLVCGQCLAHICTLPEYASALQQLIAA